MRAWIMHRFRLIVAAVLVELSQGTLGLSRFGDPCTRSVQIPFQENCPPRRKSDKKFCFEVHGIVFDCWIWPQSQQLPHQGQEQLNHGTHELCAVVLLNTNVQIAPPSVATVSIGLLHLRHTRELQADKLVTRVERRDENQKPQ